ncbi:unnamed protein product [Acanthoscelides obtectus]|uniref:Protein kinase domain-containing protein n=1 Tax=Acanthoscelides obtectus TaxID=200917 RepID=A0A9P0PE81_ACAOB|nr:unnamed protein product [Acanthoscelides obtectus]CAK1672108.1 Mitogen-activated protein kinase 15 [Acanthoscelides obtectus]
METDLHNVIKRGNILKDIHKRYIMYQLLKAIKYIHSGNVIHRDLKPSNVLLDSLCRCKIADFGLARSLTQGSEGTIGEYVATRWYRAPEILIANRRYTKGIDMWSLGCILAEMSVGKPIFPGTSTVNQVEKIMATIPTPSTEDLTVVCVSGVGSSMIKNAAAVQKVPLHTLMGSNIRPDAISLINDLLVFNPLKRLTAEEALEHEYVSRFHDPDQEIVMPSNVTIPLNDDVRLSVDDYRNKLYEIMTAHQRRVITTKPNITVKKIFPPEVYSKVTKNAERYIKSHVVKERSCISQSEPRMNNLQHKQHQQWLRTAAAHIRSDSKVMQQTAPSAVSNSSTRHRESSLRAGVDYNQQMKSTSEVPKRKVLPSRTNLCNSFNSYNKNHGIITQSALMELRAAGLR